MGKRVILSDNVLEQLETMIVRNMEPGEKLPTEMELAESFSVGRSTIRESMKVLSAKGLITRRNEGTFVSERVNKCLIDPLNLLVNMKIGNVEDLLELRQLLELGTIRIAAERATPEVLSELERINWQMSEPGLSAPALQSLDISFHNAISGATGNTVLMELLNAIRQVIAKNLEDCEAVVPVLDESMDIHQQLVEAMRAHNGTLAYEIMERYFKMTRRQDAFHGAPNAAPAASD